MLAGDFEYALPLLPGGLVLPPDYDGPVVLRVHYISHVNHTSPISAANCATL